MRGRKGRLLKRAANAGWAWAWDYADHTGRVLTVLALLLGGGTISAVQVGWWGPVVAFVVLGLLASVVGGLTEWEKDDKRVEQEDTFQAALAGLETRCYDHIAKVDRFLSARRIAGPPREQDRALALRKIGAPQDVDRGAEAERHERETVAAFIESEHLDRGIGLIDFLIEWNFVNPGTRQNVAEPKTIHHIEDGLLSIRWGAEHMPIYR